MRIEVKIISETKNSTLSGLYIDGVFFCFVLEDGFRSEKIKAETRIPDGEYKVFKKKYGGFFYDYKQRFGHEFSIGIDDVQGFTEILIHIGNTNTDTAGCLLVGFRAVSPQGLNFEVTHSEHAYKVLYEKIKSTDEPIIISIKRTSDVLFVEKEVILTVEKDMSNEMDKPEPEPIKKVWWIELLKIFSSFFSRKRLN